MLLWCQNLMFFHVYLLSQLIKLNWKHFIDYKYGKRIGHNSNNLERHLLNTCIKYYTALQINISNNYSTSDREIRKTLFWMFVIHLCLRRSWIQSNKKKKENENKRKKSQRTWSTAFFLKSAITYVIYYWSNFNVKIYSDFIYSYN